MREELREEVPGVAGREAEGEQERCEGAGESQDGGKVA